jgi:hypothetical protein
MSSYVTSSSFVFVAPLLPTSYDSLFGGPFGGEVVRGEISVLQTDGSTGYLRFVVAGLPLIQFAIF